MIGTCDYARGCVWAPGHAGAHMTADQVREARRRPKPRLREYRGRLAKPDRRSPSLAKVARQNLQYLVGEKLSDLLCAEYRLQWGDAEPSSDDPGLYVSPARLRALPSLRPLIDELEALLRETLDEARPPDERNPRA